MVVSPDVSKSGCPLFPQLCSVLLPHSLLTLELVGTVPRLLDIHSILAIRSLILSYSSFNLHVKKYMHSVLNL